MILDRLGTSIKAALAPDLAGLVGKVADIGTVLVLGTFLTVFLLLGTPWLLFVTR